MNVHVLAWSQFLLCVAVIGFAGVRLIRYGDAIADHTGMSRSWIGMVLVATVTSLPELVAGLSAVTLASAPDLAVGDALGSCVFNLAVLAMLDVLYRKDVVFAVADRSHQLSAGFGVVLLAAAALVLLLSTQGLLPNVGHVSAGSLVLIALYGLAMRVLFLAEQRHRAHVHAPVNAPAIPLRGALSGYALMSALIVGFGIWLPLVGVELARLMGWTDSFVGTLLVALATSVPEVATTWGALRIGAVDMAVANLLGSNLFDVAILAIDDVAYLPGSLFTRISPMHAVSALSACVMTGAVVVALAFRPVARVWRIGSWASIALLALYLTNGWLLFRHGQ